MARRRYVSTDISDDDAVAELVRRRGYLAALFYTWLIPHADDQCNLPAHSPKKLLSIVMPQLALMQGTRRVKEDDIANALEEMIELGLLEREEDGTYHFPEASFYRYQTYVNEAKRRPAAFSGVQRRSAAFSGVSVTPSNVSVSSSPSVSATATAPPPDYMLQPRPNIFRFYQQLLGRGVSPLIADRLKEYEQSHTAECIEHCFVEAAESNAKSVKLLYSILDRHKTEGCLERKPMGRNATSAQTPGDAPADAARIYASFGITDLPVRLPVAGREASGMAPLDGSHDS